MTQDDPWRAVRAPFQLPADWHPVEGECSRCHQPAISNGGLWWHDGPSCQRHDTQFIPDPPEGGPVPEQHTVVITVEASGEVTPAPQPDTVEATEEKESTDG